MSRIQYEALSVRNSDMVKVSVKGNVDVLSVQRKTTRASIVTIRSAPIVVNLIWRHLKIVNIFSKKKKSKRSNQKENISYPEARRFVSAANDSPAQKSYASVANRVFNTVETQTMFTWIEDTEKPTRLTVKPKEKIITPSTKKSSSSQTATTSNTVKTSVSSPCSTMQKILNKSSKSQHSRGPPQDDGKLTKVHNKYGHLEDLEDESVWNLPPDDSPSPLDESPSETMRSPSRSSKGGRRKSSQQKQSFSPIRHP